VLQLAATLQCAGNRRDQLMSVEAITGEVPWSIEAISNATWEGVRLRDVLEVAGVDPSGGAAHVEFIGLDQIDRHGEQFGFGGSIPLEKARSPEVLIAWGMNGKPLEPVHGFPLRVVVPGYIGARSVKWLTQINVIDRPSKNYFQSHAYKLFPPSVKPANVDWSGGEMIGEFGINSAITSPEAGATVNVGELALQGWAVSAGQSVARVEVSTDGGRTWTGAEFVDRAETPWCWRRWKARVTLPRGEHQLVVRAFDSAGTTQPADAKALWIGNGSMTNAWPRVTVHAQ
jgi:sulfite oxidase